MGWAYRLRHPGQTVKKALLAARMRRLTRQNEQSNMQVTDPGGPVVSLTTYSKRIHSVHLTLETIASGSLRPSRLILYLDEMPLIDNPPEALRRLQARGLEIIHCTNDGPFKKYYPYVVSQPEYTAALVTADDDVLYRADWLHGLARASGALPQAIHCYRGRHVSFDGEAIARYRDLKLLTDTVPRICNMATGVSGILYPPAFQLVMKQAGDGFKTACPRGDDLWLHMLAVRARIPVRQVTAEAQEFPELPGTQDIALYLENVTNQDGNDRIIESLYSESDLAALRACAASVR
jgi:hypothetical protein